MSWDKRCLHDRRAVCANCSDQVSWWKDARLRAGLGEAPPNAPPYIPAPENEAVMGVLVRGGVAPSLSAPVNPLDRAAWEELSPIERRLLIVVAQEGAEGYDVDDFGLQFLRELKALQAIGYIGIDTDTGRWVAGNRGRAVFESIIAARAGAA